MKATWKLLKDGRTWGVKVVMPGVNNRPLEPGEKISVTKKDGSAKDEIIEKVLWKGEKDGETIFLCTVERQAQAKPRRSSSSGWKRGRGGGSAASVPGYSSYCTGGPGCGCYDCAS